MAIPSISLPTGAKLPMLGYGTGTIWMKESEELIDRRTVDAIKDAIALGYRHLDSAQYYLTEPELGLAIEESGIPRSDLFLTAKAVSPKNVEQGLRQSLKKLRTDYVDLWLIHEPFSSGGDNQVLQNAWKEMEICLEKGLARAIGVSNFLKPHLEAILQVAKVRPMVNQIELHPYLQRAELREYLRKEGIQVEVFAPLSPLTKGAPGPIDGICEELAKKYSVNAAAVLLRWSLDQGYPVLSTSSKKERLQQYLEQVPTFQLTQAEVSELSKAGKEKNFRQFFVPDYGENCFD